MNSEGSDVSVPLSDPNFDIVWAINFVWNVSLPSIFFGLIKIISEPISPEEGRWSPFIVVKSPNPSYEYLMDNSSKITLCFWSCLPLKTLEEENFISSSSCISDK